MDRSEARATTAASGARLDNVRAQISRYYGGTDGIIAVRRSGSSGAFLFVADTTQRAHHLRTLGTIGRSSVVIEHSAMDLLHPERLVFSYERVMLIALALADAPRSVLLLGLGGGAMCRHLSAYLPETQVTVVERDSGVIALAREHFRVDQKIIRGDAEEIVADRRGEFDAILVDVYDATGTPPLEDSFWRDCLAALRPGGCIAINWAGSPEGGSPKKDIARVAKELPGSFLVTLRGLRPNTVQFTPTAASFRVADLTSRFRDFAIRHALPREDRDILNRCAVTARFRMPTREDR